MKSAPRSTPALPDSPQWGGQWRMPAEWEPHEATWIGWPHNIRDWPGKFAAIPWVFAEVVRQLTPGEKVHILVDGPVREQRARRLLDKLKEQGLSLRDVFLPRARPGTGPA